VSFSFVRVLSDTIGPRPHFQADSVRGEKKNCSAASLSPQVVLSPGGRGSPTIGFWASGARPRMGKTPRDTRLKPCSSKGTA
jgi:hypothetical protein